MRMTQAALGRRATVRAYIATAVLALRRAEASLNAAEHEDRIAGALNEATDAAEKARIAVLRLSA